LFCLGNFYFVSKFYVSEYEANVRNGRDAALLRLVPVY